MTFTTFLDAETNLLISCALLMSQYPYIPLCSLSFSMVVDGRLGFFQCNEAIEDCSKPRLNMSCFRMRNVERTSTCRRLHVGVLSLHAEVAARYCSHGAWGPSIKTWRCEEHVAEFFFYRETCRGGRAPSCQVEANHASVLFYNIKFMKLNFVIIFLYKL